MRHIAYGHLDENRSEGRRRLTGRLLPSLLIILTGLFFIVPADEAHAGHGFAIGAGALAGPVLSTSVVVGLGLTSSTGVVIAFIVSVSKDDTARLQRYLHDNQSDVRASLAMGGGPFVSDLAQMFGVSPEHEDAFGELLLSEREGLLATYEDDVVTLEEASVVVEAILQGMRARPGLSASLLDQITWTTSRDVYSEHLSNIGDSGHEVAIRDLP